MSNIPKLRFPEFSGEWEEKKLSDFMTRLTRKNSNNESSRALTISSVDGLIDQGEFFKKQIASKDTSGYYLLKKGDFAYNKSYSVGYDYGSIKRLDRYEDGVVSTLYICMSLTSDTNSDYLTHYFDSMKWNKSVSEISAEGARNHGLLNIPTEAFFQTKHFLAPSSAEQQKIANFLSNVDSIITAETKILNILQKKKKALMQKLFTQQLRFKSADGKDFPAWKEKKLGEIAIFSKGSGYSKNDLVSSGTPVILYGRLYTKYETVISDVDTFVQEKKNSVISVGNEIIVPASGETAEDISRASVVKHNGIILGGDLNIIKVDLNHYIPEFIALCISNGEPKKRMAKLAQGKTIVHLHNSDLQQLIFSIPCKEEQQKIADCLSSIDSLIQTQQNVVTTWQQRKKALLQQMFI